MSKRSMNATQDEDRGRCGKPPLLSTLIEYKQKSAKIGARSNGARNKGQVLAPAYRLNKNPRRWA